MDGKTYSICDFCDNVFPEKIIISNVESFCYFRKNRTIYMTDILEIIKFLDSLEDCSNYIVFFDELFSTVGTAGSNAKLSKEVRRFLSQLRKRKLYFLTSAQDWGELPRGLRKLCRYQISCRMINFLWFGFAICINEINSGYDIKWSDADQEYICPRIKTTIKKASLKTACSYDTFEVITSTSSITV